MNARPIALAQNHPALRRPPTTGEAVSATAILLCLVVTACGQSSYSRAYLTGSQDAEVGALKGFGDGSADLGVATGGATGVVATGGSGTAAGTGGSPGASGGATGNAGDLGNLGNLGNLGSAGSGSIFGATGGGRPSSSGGFGFPASGGSNGSGSGGVQSGGTTVVVPPGSGGAPGSGGRGTGGAGSGGASSGGATIAHTGGSTGSGGAAPSLDRANDNFEASTEGWGMAAGGAPFSSVGKSAAEHFAGLASLAGVVTDGAAGKTYILEVAPPVPAVPPGATVTFHVLVPSAAQLNFVQPYVLNDVSKFVGAFTLAGSLKRDGWTTITLVVPATETNVTRLGVQFASSGAWTGTVYVDSIDW